MVPPSNLARPDVFHPSIVLAGCPQWVDGDGDDDGLVEALRRRGLHARWLSWDDPQTETADLVILRAAWDYADRRDEFLAWTSRVRNLLNAREVVAWNSDKHYLQDLADAGVPSLASYFFEPGEKVKLPKGELVVKPAIGAGSIDTGRFVDHAAARAHVAALLDSGRTALVQPYDARVEQGETALVFLGGRQSHAFTKGPVLPPDGKQTADPDFAMWGVGVAALAAACGHLGIATSELLYARVDLIGGADDPVLLELEVIEPGLGWLQLDETTRELQQRTFALEVESALERLGLGPLSHRRP